MLVKRVAALAYTSIFNRLRAIKRDNWSEIAIFSYTPLHLTHPLGCSHWNSGEKFGPQKTRIMGQPGSEDSLTIGYVELFRTFESTQYHQRVTDRQTNGRTDVQPIDLTCALRSMTDAR